MLRLPLAVGAVNALIRLVSLSRAQRPPLLPALRIALAPRARIATGARGLVTGFIGEGLAFRRAEAFAVCTEHLGMETVEDSQGNGVTRDRYHTWYERRARASGPARIRLVLDNGRVVSAPAPVQTTGIGMRYEGPGDGYARFIGQHGEGDEATLLGTIESVDGEITMEATHLVLGDLSVLRRRVGVQLGALILLVSIVVVGVAAALL